MTLVEFSHLQAGLQTLGIMKRHKLKTCAGWIEFYVDDISADGYNIFKNELSF